MFAGVEGCAGRGGCVRVEEGVRGYRRVCAGRGGCVRVEGDAWAEG